MALANKLQEHNLIRSWVWLEEALAFNSYYTLFICIFIFCIIIWKKYIWTFYYPIIGLSQQVWSRRKCFVWFWSYCMRSFNEETVRVAVAFRFQSGKVTYWLLPSRAEYDCCQTLSFQVSNERGILQKCFYCVCVF